VREAAEGEGVARGVTEKFGEIAAAVAKVSGIVSAIDAAARDQAAGVDTVSAAVSEMDRLTQANAASAEESSFVADLCHWGARFRSWRATGPTSHHFHLFHQHHHHHLGPAPSLHMLLVHCHHRPFYL